MTPELALHYDDGDLSEILAKCVTFHAERINKDAWWLVCTFEEGNRLTLWIRREGQKLMMSLMEKPS